MSQHIDPTPKQTDIDELNSKSETASTDINNLKTKTYGLVKMYGAGNARYLKITLASYLNYGSLLVLCNGHTTTFYFNGGTPTRVEGTAFNITKSGDTCIVDFGSQYAHWVAIAGGSVSQGAFVASN